MRKIISVANQKGGVGKTTTVVNLASCLAELGHAVLLVDLDPQGNSSSGCGIDKRTVQASVYDVLIGEVEKPQDAIVQTEYKNLAIMPSTLNLAGAEIELVDMENRSNQLKKALELCPEYEYILIDCPPSLGLLTINALTASHSVLIPIQCEFYALEGLSQLTNTIRQVKKRYNPNLDIEGVLVTMFDGRLNLTNQVLSDVKRFFADKMFRTVIPRNVRLSEAPSHGIPINYYEKASKGSLAYKELAAEILERNQRKG